MNIVDILVIAILVVSGLLAFFRGFVHEVLAITAWVGAVFAALYGFSHAQPIARDYITITWAADLAAGASIFLATLLLLSLLTKAISKRVRESALNSVDRSLGFIFGVARGALLVSLAYMLGVWLMEPGAEPDWLMQARARPLMERGAGMVQAIVPDQLAGSEAKARELQKQAEELQRAQETLQKLTSPMPLAPADSAKPPSDTGYDQDERRQLDRLFQSQQ